MILVTEAPVIKKEKGNARRRLLQKIPIPKIPKVELRKIPKKVQLGLRNRRLKSIKDYLRGKFRKKHKNPKSDNKEVPGGALWEKEKLPGEGFLDEKKVPGGDSSDKEKLPGGGSLDRKEVPGGSQDNSQSMRVLKVITRSEDVEFRSFNGSSYLTSSKSDYD